LLNMADTTFSLVLPTYNERDNIKIFIPQLIETCKRWDIEIIIVDDGSDDGTIEEIKKIQDYFKNINLIQRESLSGIGSALIDGYNSAKGKYIISCDSDMSFLADDIKKIGEMLLTDTYDLVIGSRYLSGSYYEAPNLKILQKKIISKLGNIFLRFINRIPTHDFSANCRGIKNSVWKKLRVKNKNNFMLFETIWRAHQMNLVIKELPVRFLDRKFGSSKLKSGREVARSLILFLKLKFEKDETHY